MVSLDKEAIQVFSLLKDEPAWMSQLRGQALDQLDQLDLPKIERVNFKRWNLFSPSIGQGDSLILDLPQVIQPQEGAASLVQLGAVTYLEDMTPQAAEQGLVVMDLFQAMETYPDLVQEYFMTKAVPWDENQLTAYHAAMVNSGLFIYVPKNLEVKDLVQAFLVQNATLEEAFVKHILIVVDENASLNYVEDFQTVGDQANTANIVVEVIAKPGAKVNFTAIDHLGPHTQGYLNRRAYLEKDAQIHWNIAALHEGSFVCDFDSELVGQGSQAIVNVTGISTGQQSLGIDTRVTNRASHSVGHIFQHGVILDKSSLTFNGIGHILKGAKGADAQQESRVLVLSPGGRGDANPILLIDEFEVTAGHAASVGQIDQEQLFYLMSRGISEVQAKSLVIQGFLGEVVRHIPDTVLQRQVMERIEAKLVKTYA